jgi:partner of Y14 and mago
MCPKVAQQERTKREKNKQQQTKPKPTNPIPGLLVLNDKKTTTKSKPTIEQLPQQKGATNKPTANSKNINELTEEISDMQIDTEKKLKKLKKKLREIESIEEKVKSGELKNPEKDQLDKISRKPQIVKEISQIEATQN